MEDKETGELCQNIICIKCNNNVNMDTGETEYIKIGSKPQFKIPFVNKEEEQHGQRKIIGKICCNKSPHKYCLLLAYITLSVILPQLALTLWVFAETVYHLYLHKIKATGQPLHGLLVSEYCAICQSERSMTLIGKLQDVRTNKMRQYVKNIPIVS